MFSEIYGCVSRDELSNEYPIIYFLREYLTFKLLKQITTVLIPILMLIFFNNLTFTVQNKFKLKIR